MTAELAADMSVAPEIAILAEANIGPIDIAVHDQRTVGLHWQIHKDSTTHAAIAERRGERLPVAIAFGCPPAVTYAASAPTRNTTLEAIHAAGLGDGGEGAQPVAAVDIMPPTVML